MRIGNEDLEAWLSRMLHPRIDFRIHEIEIDGHHVVLLEVSAAVHTPVRSQESEFIRVGSYKKKLKEHPEKERERWASFSRVSLESGISLTGVEGDVVLGRLNYPSYFDLVKQPLPDNIAGILSRLSAENLVVKMGEDCFDITNLGGILFAKDMARFPSLARKRGCTHRSQFESSLQTCSSIRISSSAALGQ